MSKAKAIEKEFEELVERYSKLQRISKFLAERKIHDTTLGELEGEVTMLRKEIEKMKTY